jgi:hypothetical protein
LVPTIPALPDDIEMLKRMLIGRDEMITKLMVEIARLKRWRFGRSTEQTDVALLQLQLALSDLQVAAADEVAILEAVPVEESTTAMPLQPSTRLRRVPRAFPAHLPRETIVHAPASCTCPDCGAAMRKLGEDTSEMLDFVPGYFKVLRHVRPKLSCSHCAGPGHTAKLVEWRAKNSTTNTRRASPPSRLEELLRGEPPQSAVH